MRSLGSLCLGSSLLLAAACVGPEPGDPLPTPTQDAGAPAPDASAPAPDAGSPAADAGPKPDAGGPNACGLPLEPGPCNAAFQRYGFDATQGRCVEFLWGGCGGNANNFESMADCVAACGGPSGPVACGGWSGPTCGSDEFCDFAGDGCDYADASGVCQERPQACTEEYDPVCGCDGVTYGNLCSAHASGVDAARAGPCEGPAGACEDTSRDTIIAGGGQSFGFCGGECLFDLSLRPPTRPNRPVCDQVQLEVCSHDHSQPCRLNLGQLTEAGHAEAREAARALGRVQLDPVYGCPDCADGGAGELRLIRNGRATTHAYDLTQVPRILERSHRFLEQLLRGLNECRANAIVEPLPGCTPRQ